MPSPRYYVIYSTLKLPFGQAADGRLVHVNEVECGLASECVCPACAEKLIARKGAVRAAHFAHRSGAECAHAVETAPHRAAKEILLRRRAIMVPRTSGRTGAGMRWTRTTIVTKDASDPVEREPRLPRGRSGLAFPMGRLNRLEQKKAKRKKQLRHRQAQLAPTAGSSADRLANLPEAEPGVGVPLAVIPEPAKGSRTLLDSGGGGMPVMFGHAHDAPDYLCGRCGYRLLHATKLEEMKELRDAVVVCPECGAFNDLASQPADAANANDSLS